MKLVSWNVNSLRAAEGKFLEFIDKEKPDIILLQEVRAHPDQLSVFVQCIPGYGVKHNFSGKPGYGGTAVYYRNEQKIDSISTVTGKNILDGEGRTIKVEMGPLVILNFYVPNGNSHEERLVYKLNFYKEMLAFVKELLQDEKQVIIGGDLNVAATEMDLFSPKTNKQHSGFLIEERKWFSEMEAMGMMDSFRMFNQDGGNYTWWHMRDPTRKNNQGWRYDYFLVSKNLKDRVKRAEILKNVYGSDHCPILVEIN